MAKHYINVSNPERHGGDGLNNSYISYEISSTFDEKEFKVRRRYQDFLWLVDQFKHDFPERLIPPLPDKNRLEYLGRFTPDFIKRRQLGLKRFLWRIDEHLHLGSSELFESFLKAPVVGMSFQAIGLKMRCTSEVSISEVSSVSTAAANSEESKESFLKPVIDGLGEVASSIFSRSPNEVPEVFSKLRKNVKIVKSHLSHLERLFSNRVSGHQPAIIEGMKEIAGNFDELSASIDLSLNVTENGNNNNNTISPPFVKSMLSRVSATMTQCAHVLDKSIDEQEINLLAVLLEYTQYCDSALELIELRDRRQVEVEELTKLVVGYEQELLELEGHVNPIDNEIEADNGNNHEINTENSSSFTPLTTKTSFFDYLNTKWDSWKGVDPITAKKSRLNKCQYRLKETESALKTCQKLSSRADSALAEEITIFLATLKEELGREFDGHAKSQVKYHETNLVYWKDFLAWLDNPPKHL